MVAKSEAEFINRAVTGSNKICSNCQSVNRPEASFCITCGEKLEEQAHDMAFKPIDEVSANENDAYAETAVTDNIYMEKEIHIKSYDEQKGVFAEGLPLWSIEPPQVMVRRKR